MEARESSGSECYWSAANGRERADEDVSQEQKSLAKQKGVFNGELSIVNLERPSIARWNIGSRRGTGEDVRCVEVGRRR